MKRILYFFCSGLVTKDDLAQSERRIKEFIAKVAMEGDKAKIQAMIEQLKQSGAALKNAIEQNQ